MRIVPLTLAQANKLVTDVHRHHKKVTGHRFSLGAVKNNMLVGAAIIGRPVAPKTDQNNIAEVIRLVTDGTKNACSFLYAAAARTAREMGFEQIQTFILDEETGVSLAASGWEYVGVTGKGDWTNRPGRYKDDVISKPKKKYRKVLNPVVALKEAA